MPTWLIALSMVGSTWVIYYVARVVSSVMAPKLGLLEMDSTALAFLAALCWISAAAMGGFDDYFKARMKARP